MRALFFTLISNYLLHSSFDYDEYKYRGTHKGPLRRVVVLLRCPLIFMPLVFGLRAIFLFICNHIATIEFIKIISN